MSSENITEQLHCPEVLSESPIPPITIEAENVSSFQILEQEYERWGEQEMEIRSKLYGPQVHEEDSFWQVNKITNIEECVMRHIDTDTIDDYILKPYNLRNEGLSYGHATVYLRNVCIKPISSNYVKLLQQCSHNSFDYFCNQFWQVFDKYERDYAILCRYCVRYYLKWKWNKTIYYNKVHSHDLHHIHCISCLKCYYLECPNSELLTAHDSYEPYQQQQTIVAQYPYNGGSDELIHSKKVFV